MWLSDVIERVRLLSVRLGFYHLWGNVMPASCLLVTPMTGDISEYADGSKVGQLMRWNHDACLLQRGRKQHMNDLTNDMQFNIDTDSIRSLRGKETPNRYWITYSSRSFHMPTRLGSTTNVRPSAQEPFYWKKKKVRDREMERQR